MQAFCCQHTDRSNDTPGTDAFGDATQSLEVGPFRELVFLGCGSNVCADDADGEVWDIGKWNLGAVELEVDG